MATVQTATGPVEEEKLGFTLSHEHIIVGSAGVPDDGVDEVAVGKVTADNPRRFLAG